ncbi:hypothetical protein GCM10017691_23830 [Pseudonocardia petroleophila]|uniref:Uncharacterized protein n=1 Tax=Pseudonocardia petroleophila TaxID=37331 RepID=A0A7G7MFW0_9PSEU|nr:hypothetical protein [Pseudonocardia petroleophila]QNG51671.1 hypothetical protein H6H00_26785 [Pseudonocardia petroleophila]
MIDNLADLESDFSVFHRVDDIYSLDGPRFFQWAYRITAYEGMVKMRWMAEDQKRSQQPDQTPAPQAPAKKKESVKQQPFGGLLLGNPELFEVTKVKG